MIILEEKFNPLIQTFSVPRDYLEGVYIDSIDLFFQTKDRVGIPVTLSLGPTVNGIPNYKVTYKDASVTLFPSSVRTSSNTNLNTTFKFEKPVYLPPGIHYFSVKSNSNQYELYTAVQGANEFGSNRVISKSPYTGDLYLPSDEESRVVLNEDIKFVMYNCSFTNSVGQIVFTNNYESFGGTIESPSVTVDNYSKYFDLFNFSSDDFNFNTTEIKYRYKRTNESGTLDSTYSDFNQRLNNIVTRSKLASNSFYVSASMSTKNKFVTPIIDKDRVDSVFVRNFLNNDTTGENGLVGGNTESKYVTKVVQLLPDVEANDLAVFAYLKLPTLSDVKVYYKAAPAGVDIVTQTNYVEMTREVLGTPNTNEFVEYKFTTPSSYALPDQSNFNKFQVKVLLLSSDPNIAPVVREFRVIALND